MLTKYKYVKRLDPEKGANMPFENVSCQTQRRIQNIFCGELWHQIFTFFKSSFYGRVNLKQITCY